MIFFLDQDVPDDLEYALRALGYSVVHLRDVLPVTTPDNEVLRYCLNNGCIMITCNRDDFLELAPTLPHHGIIILIRRRTRTAESAAMVQLLDRAGETGIRNNINFA
jgi:predicted nuclease of predicted toxin-antitoxin system